MAIDTAQKRRSAVGVGLPFVLTLPDPDGSTTQADRQEITFTYAGISALAVQVPTPSEVLTLFPDPVVLTLFPDPSVLTSE